jgi:hypothetical protein
VDVSTAASISRLRLALDLCAAILSPPHFDALGAGGLVTRPVAGVRIAQLVLALFVAGMAAIFLSGSGGTLSDEFEAVLATLAAVSLLAALLLVPRHLSARFDDDTATVVEWGLLGPRRWSEPLGAFTGLAWYRRRVTQGAVYRSLSSNETRMVGIDSIIPRTIEYHWVELVHPDPSKSLTLCAQTGAFDMERKLDLCSRRLGRPVIARPDDEQPEDLPP